MFAFYYSNLNIYKGGWTYDIHLGNFLKHDMQYIHDINLLDSAAR